MKNFRNIFCCLMVCFLLLSGCSKEDNINAHNNAANKATLSFGALLNNMIANKVALKQAMEMIPECSDDIPSYVEVVLNQDGAPVVGTLMAPLRVEVNPNPGDYDGDGIAEYFTKESAQLELAPGAYSLEHFIVYGADDTMLWVAPRTDGELAGFVDNTLPFSFDLGAGVKKYVNVDVLCFDNRMVNEYGYLFFDIEKNKAFEFCFFANLCDNNGRHYPASISVDIWLGTDNSGTMLYANVMNTVENEGDDPSAKPVCFALPNLPEFEDNEDYIYYEVTVQDWEGVYGDVENSVISGTLSRNDIMANFDGEDKMDYEHLRFGCNDTPEGDGGRRASIY